MSKLYIDVTNGISGDMVLMALRGLGAEADLTGKLHFHDHTHDHGNAHAHTSYHDVLHIIAHSDVSEGAKETARSIYGVIAKAEARVHGATLETVHFHEVGRQQAVENILSVAQALEELGVEEVFCSEVHDGHGTILCSHGEIPVPVPAVAAMMQESSLTFVTDDVPTEMVTPSGLGILMGIGAEGVSEMPAVFQGAPAAVGKGGRDIGREGLTIRLAE